MKIKSLLIFLVLFSCVLTTHAQKPVYLIKVDASINPSTADYIRKGLEEAKKNNAECLIIELNTPGGLLKSTRYIISDILTSDIPVIVYVSPGGSQAGSAGVFITLAGNLAVMSPGTNIGAAHPVSGDGKMDSVMNEKVTNDAAAFIRSISEKRKRNMQWAEDAVRLSVSISENEAMQKGVIDFIAKDVNELLQMADGREVETAKGKWILNTKNSPVVKYEMSFLMKFLGIISDPNIAYILMMVGMWGIILEFYHPGGILPGVVGVIAIVLGLYGLHTLPVNFAGLILILLGIVLFIAEIKVTSYGMLTVGGVISLFLGSIFLIDTDSGLEVVEISLTVIIGTVLMVTLLFMLLGWLVIRAHKKKVTSGIEGMVGEEGVVTNAIHIGKKGMVKLHGELWNAVQNGDTDIKKGDRIKVISVNDLTLTVQKV